MLKSERALYLNKGINWFCRKDPYASVCGQYLLFLERIIKDARDHELTESAMIVFLLVRPHVLNQPLISILHLLSLWTRFLQRDSYNSPEHTKSRTTLIFSCHIWYSKLSILQ